MSNHFNFTHVYKYLLNIINICILSLLLSSCGGGGSSSGDSTPFDEDQKNFLYNLFQTEYLWSEQVPTLDPSQFNSAESMIDALKYSTYDKWSYSETLEEYTNRSEQKTQGFGCSYNNITISKIEFYSPCYNAGLKRGDKVIKIDNKDATSETYTAAQNNLNVEALFTVIRGSQELDIAITPLVYNYKASIAGVITKSDGTKIGHLLLDEFTSSSADEIDDTFTYFKNSSIDELIVDLRYNGGGSLNTASILMDKIAAYNNHDLVQMHLKWNDANTHEDSYYRFYKDDNSINLSRVFFLTTYATASASEMTINGLKPFIDVKVIGSKTRGKPVGMRGKTNKDLIYWLINFSVYNSNDLGEYYNGIDVDCYVSDTYDFERINENDPILGKALYYIDNGTCI